MIKEERIVKEFMELTAVDSPSYGEREITDLIKEKLAALGFEVREDDAAGKLGGNAGNLYAFLEGDVETAPILFCCHTDTVEPSRNWDLSMRHYYSTLGRSTEINHWFVFKEGLFL